MKITIYTLGKIKNKEVANLIETYIKTSKSRIANPKLEQIVLPDPNTAGKVDPVSLTAKYKIPETNTYLLSEHGQEYSTDKFINLLSQYRQQAEDVNIICGNAWGWNLDDRNQFKLLSLSKLILNHELAQLVLWEQLYRLVDKLNGGAYEK